MKLPFPATEPKVKTSELTIAKEKIEETSNEKAQNISCTDQQIHTNQESKNKIEEKSVVAPKSNFWDERKSSKLISLEKSDSEIKSNKISQSGKK